jgi:hypothetical protein
MKSAPMVTHTSFGISRTILRCVTVAVLALSLGGCSALSQHLNGMLDVLSIRARQHRELSSIRQDTRAKLAAQQQEVLKTESQREVEEARIDAQRRQLEAEFCLANQEQQQRQVKDKLRQTVESKVAFNVEQGLEVGELEVYNVGLMVLIVIRVN